MVQSVNLGALSRWMDERGFGSGPLSDVTLLTGGTQNILVKFRRSARDYVLRRPPENLRRNSNETMVREARVLEALERTTVPHPGLIAACSDPAVIGACFYLMEPVDGINPVAGLSQLQAGSASVRHRMGLSLIEAIAELGMLNVDVLGLSDLGRPDNFLERQVGRWKRLLASYGETAEWDGLTDLPGVHRIGSWLEEHRPAAARTGIIHGDCHLANTMFRTDSGELAALVDWELTTLGDPLIDLGWLLATWPESADNPGVGSVGVVPWDGFATPEELVSHYSAYSDRDVSAIEWYAVLACYKLGIIQEGTYARACAGKVPLDVGENLHNRTIWLLQRALQWIS